MSGEDWGLFFFYIGVFTLAGCVPSLRRRWARRAQSRRTQQPAASTALAPVVPASITIVVTLDQTITSIRQPWLDLVSVTKSLPEASRQARSVKMQTMDGMLIHEEWRN